MILISSFAAVIPARSPAAMPAICHWALDAASSPDHIRPARWEQTMANANGNRNTTAARNAKPLPRSAP